MQLTSLSPLNPCCLTWTPPTPFTQPSGPCCLTCTPSTPFTHVSGPSAYSLILPTPFTQLCDILWIPATPFTQPSGPLDPTNIFTQPSYPTSSPDPINALHSALCLPLDPRKIVKNLTGDLFCWYEDEVETGNTDLQECNNCHFNHVWKEQVLHLKCRAFHRSPAFNAPPPIHKLCVCVCVCFILADLQFFLDA